MKVTYYEERLVEVEDELNRVKEDRRQASVQVCNFFCPFIILKRLILFNLYHAGISVSTKAGI